tara:strand:- start:5280 stop:5570 length:291 start_codon:yes stop_codon:yes gene_type:complete
MFDSNFEELNIKYAAAYEAEKRFTEAYAGTTVPNYVGLSFAGHLDRLEYEQYKMMRESKEDKLDDIRHRYEDKKKLVDVCPHCGENPNEPKEKSWT